MEGIMENNNINYTSVRINSDGERFCLCKNCRKPMLLGDGNPHILGNLCSSKCIVENAEFYK